MNNVQNNPSRFSSRPLASGEDTPPQTPPSSSSSLVETTTTQSTTNAQNGTILNTGMGGLLEYNKKLKPFFTAEKPPRKRLKAIIDFFHTVAKDLVVAFWEEHYNNVYNLLVSTLSELETLYIPYPSTFGNYRIILMLLKRLNN